MNQSWYHLTWRQTFNPHRAFIRTLWNRYHTHTVYFCNIWLNSNHDCQVCCAKGKESNHSSWLCMGRVTRRKHQRSLIMCTDPCVWKTPHWTFFPQTKHRRAPSYEWFRSHYTLRCVVLRVLFNVTSEEYSWRSGRCTALFLHPFVPESLTSVSMDTKHDTHVISGSVRGCE